MSNQPGFNSGNANVNPAPTDNTVNANTTKQKTTTSGRRLLGNSRVTLSGSKSDKEPARVLRAIEEVLGEVDFPKGEELYAVSVTDPSINVPNISIYNVSPQGETDVVSLMLPAYGKLAPARVNTYMGQQIVSDNYAYMHSTPETNRFVRDKVVRDLERRNINATAPTAVRSIVIPETIDLSEDAVVNNIKPYLDAVIFTIYGERAKATGEPTSNLSVNHWKTQGSRLVNFVEVAPGSTYRSNTGELVAGDFCINLRLQEIANTNRTSINTSNGEEVVSSVVGFIDLSYRAQSPMYQFQNQGIPQQHQPLYDPVIVLTDISAVGKSVCAEDSIISALLGITSIASAAGDGRWVNLFTRSGVDNGSKPSFGVLGYEHNLYTEGHTPGEIELQEPTIGGVIAPNALTVTRMVSDYCSPYPLIAVDSVGGGPQAWLLNTLLNCEPGSANYRAIVIELDNFFGNQAFSKNWDMTQPMVESATTSVFTGTFEDERLGTRDLRSIGYLDVVKASEGDLAIMTPWSNSFIPGGYTDKVMDEQRKVLMSIAPSANITGKADRIYIRVELINTIVKLLASTGLEIRTEGLMDVNIDNQRTTTFNGMTAAPMSSIRSTGLGNAGGNMGSTAGSYYNNNNIF